jgi:hypothetical protein
MAAPTLATIHLMHPSLVAKPFHRAGRVYEEKYDGWRMLTLLALGSGEAGESG